MKIGRRPVGRKKIALWVLLAVGLLTAALAGVQIYHIPETYDIPIWQKALLIPHAFLAIVFWPLSIAVFVAIVVGTATLVLRWMGVVGPRAAQGEKSARDILDERFARGELDKDEYEERRLAISS